MVQGCDYDKEFACLCKSTLQFSGMAVLLELIVIPGARTFRVTIKESMLKIAVIAPAERGKANGELCERIADLLGLPVRLVTVAGGAGSRHKLIKIETHLSRDAVLAMIFEKIVEKKSKG
mgnify:CR=1 FL=1